MHIVPPVIIMRTRDSTAFDPKLETPILTANQRYVVEEKISMQTVERGFLDFSGVSRDKLNSFGNVLLSKG